jgi:hypothetical protein
LRAAGCDAKTAHDLIKDQEDAIGTGQLPKARQKTVFRNNCSHIPRHRFHDQAGNLISHIFKGLPKGTQIIEWDGDCVACEIGRDTGRIRYPKRCGARSGLDEEGVGMAVITAFKLYNFVSTCKSPGETDGAHRRLCP